MFDYGAEIMSSFVVESDTMMGLYMSVTSLIPHSLSTPN